MFGLSNRNAMNISGIKVGDKIRCFPVHMRGGNSLRWRKVTRVERSPNKWQFSGIAVNAHGWKEFWLKESEIIEL